MSCKYCFVSILSPPERISDDFMIKNIALLIRPDIEDEKKKWLQCIIKFLDAQNIHYYFTESLRPLKFCEFLKFRDFDLMIVLGGDGMMLEAARFCAPRDIPIFGLNFGKEGFLTAGKNSEKFTDAINAVLNNSDYIENRTLVEARIYRNGNQIFSEQLALNELYVNGGGKSLTLSFDINGLFEKVIIADGLMVSTPTGSTAYNLNTGPIISPDIECLLVRPVHPYGFYIMPPLVVDTKSKILVYLINCKGLDINICADGQEYIRDLEIKDIIEITAFRKPAKIIRLYENDFWAKLQNF